MAERLASRLKLLRPCCLSVKLMAVSRATSVHLQSLDARSLTSFVFGAVVSQCLHACAVSEPTHIGNFDAGVKAIAYVAVIPHKLKHLHVACAALVTTSLNMPLRDSCAGILWERGSRFGSTGPGQEQKPDVRRKLHAGRTEVRSQEFMVYDMTGRRFLDRLEPKRLPLSQRMPAQLSRSGMLRDVVTRAAQATCRCLSLCGMTAT
jgi:hypothetical protein